MGLRSGSCAAQRLDVLPAGAVLDQLVQPALARLLALGAHHPVDRGPAVAGRARLPILPGIRVRADALLVLVGELRVLSLLEGVHAGAVLLASLEGFEAGRPHPALLGEL